MAIKNAVNAVTKLPFVVTSAILPSAAIFERIKEISKVALIKNSPFRGLGG
jgi:hypothetical protein